MKLSKKHGAKGRGKTDSSNSHLTSLYILLLLLPLPVLLLPDILLLLPQVSLAPKSQSPQQLRVRGSLLRTDPTASTRTHSGPSLLLLLLLLRVPLAPSSHMYSPQQLGMRSTPIRANSTATTHTHVQLRCCCCCCCCCCRFHRPLVYEAFSYLARRT
jgi:hypothetical protein